jgi:hypothetical protein
VESGGGVDLGAHEGIRVLGLRLLGLVVALDLLGGLLDLLGLVGLQLSLLNLLGVLGILNACDSCHRNLPGKRSDYL